MSAFKIGEVCVGQGFVINTYRNGMECSIEACRGYYDGPYTNSGRHCSGLLYAVRWSDGSFSNQMAQQLRKKHPPRSAKSIMREAINKAKQPSMEPA